MPGLVEILNEQRDLMIKERFDLLRHIDDEHWLIFQDPPADELLNNGMNDAQRNIFEANVDNNLTPEAIEKREEQTPGTCWACGGHVDAKSCTLLYWSELVRRKKYPRKKRGTLVKLGYFKCE